MQELVFWIIFSIVASVLLVSQFFVTLPTVPQVQPEKEELLPDVSKTEREAELVYENYVFSEKLSKIPEGKKIIYALGEFSGPSFDERIVKDGARQTAYQRLMTELDGIKDSISSKVLQKAGLDFSNYLDELFKNIYQRLLFDESLAVVYKIWKKTSGEVITYYYLVVFDDNYGLTIIEAIGSELIKELYEKGISFEDIWKAEFEANKKL
jgi:hypothetical protein